jgi:hypothetical protein
VDERRRKIRYPKKIPIPPKLLSVPGLMAATIFGISVIVVSRLFGEEIS